jgi:hypothetical protein
MLLLPQQLPSIPSLEHHSCHHVSATPITNLQPPSHLQEKNFAMDKNQSAHQTSGVDSRPNTSNAFSTITSKHMKQIKHNKQT